MKPFQNGWPYPGTIERRYQEINSNPEFGSRVIGIEYSTEFLAQTKHPYKDLLRIRSDLLCHQLAESFGLIYEGARWETTV